MAAAAGFGVAALTATYLAINEDASIGICAGAMAASQTALVTCSASAVASNPEAPICGTCATMLTAYSATYTKYIAARSTPGDSKVIAAETAPDKLFLGTPNNYCAGLSPGPVLNAVT
ncbi:MAG: hypothetical protein K2Q18_10735, partial [Bdellovibrionales bacterium]|nr:hypothetical protein [Bdellovibrionales bacterium]